MKSLFHALLPALFVMPLCALGQQTLDQTGTYVYQTGSPVFSTQYPVEHGFINVNNGDLHLELPIANPPQRGGILTAESRLVYDSRIWKVVQTGNSSYMWQPTNVPNSMGGWTILTGGETGSIGTPVRTYSNSGSVLVPQPGGGGLTSCQNSDDYYNKFSWTDPVGTAHVFGAQWIEHNSTCPGFTPQTNTSFGYALDGSGLRMVFSGLQTEDPSELAYTITDKNGTQLYPSIVDRNGNRISQDANGNVVDTRGNTPVVETKNGNQIDLAVTTANGTQAHYLITTEQISYATNFNEEAVSEPPGSFTAIQSIQLPDGSQYQFAYDTGSQGEHYGELTSITLPTGGVIGYGYTNFTDSFRNANRWISSRTADGGTTTFTPATISQCSSSQGCQEKTTLTTPDGSDTVYTFSLDQSGIANASSWATNITRYQGPAANNKVLRSEATTYQYQAIQRTSYSSQQVQVQTIVDSLPDAGVASQTQNTFDNNSDPDYNTDYLIDTKVWNYTSGSFAAQPDQDTAYAYTQMNGDLSLPLMNVTVTDGASHQLSKVSYDYDGRLNPTGQHQWLNTTGGTFDTASKYDNAGMIQSSTAPEGTTTYTPDATDTFVAAVTPPTPSSGAKLTSATGYDSATGAVTSVTDPNGQATQYKSFDAFNRPQEIDFPDQGKTTVNYMSLTLVSESTAFNTAGSGTTMKQNDSYGRPSRVAVATGQGANSFYQQDTCYDTSGRVQFQSYRYQGPGFGAAKVCSGAGDSYSYDALGRTTKVTHGDGTSVKYNYTGRAVEVTDENNVSRITQTDAFGRVMAACEVSSDTTMPASGSPVSCGTDIAATGFTTTYSYNPAMFQTTVTQGAQTRKFTTDSLGRQVAAQEPESGQTGWNYAYNATGLLVTRTKPRANQTDPTVLTTTQTQYDTLGRVVSVNYSDGITGAKSYGYDVPYPGTNSVNTLGRLTQQIAQTAAGQSVQAYSYDPLGRTAQVFTCTPSTCGQSIATQNYTYDYAGNITGSTDGAGAVLNYTYTPANETTGVTAEAGAFPATLVSNVVQGPFGPTSYQLGNGLNQVYRYDSLGRRDGGWLCVGSTSQFCANATERYGYTVTYGGARINQACDTVLNNCATMNYDDFSRLRGRTTNSGTTLNDSWTYDRYGNRWTQTAAPSGYQQQISVDPTTNHAVGFGYDAAGNLIADATHNYTYDAEGNILAVDGGGTAKYYYDASNLRVRTDLGSTTYDLLFDLQGHKTVITSGGNTVEEDTRMNGLPLALLLSGNLVFEHQDWLGTERILTAGDGTESGSYTSNPFGDVFGDQGADLDPYHYAGLDHDYETGLEHAQYREYSSAGGRWMSPDPYQGSYDWANPQSLNRYSYALNDPQSLSDPTGQVPCAPVFDPTNIAVCTGTIAGDALCGPVCGILFGAGLGGVVGGLEAAFGFGGPQFHGSLQPRPSVNHTCYDKPSLIPHSIGLVGSGEASAGIGAIGATAQTSEGFFGTVAGGTGYVRSATAAANYGSRIASNVPQVDTPITFGGYAGGGAGLVVSNATNLAQLAGPFESVTLSIPAASFSVSYGGGIYAVQGSFGPGFGLAHTYSTSNTTVVGNSQPCP